MFQYFEEAEDILPPDIHVYVRMYVSIVVNEGFRLSFLLGLNWLYLAI